VTIQICVDPFMCKYETASQSFQANSIIISITNIHIITEVLRFLHLADAFIQSGLHDQLNLKQ